MRRVFDVVAAAAAARGVGRGRRALEYLISLIY
jgi:hypothetical protein